MAVGSELFSDLDFADDVALLTEMLSLLVLALEIMDEQAQPLGLTINWSKTKIQTMLDPAPTGNQVTINGHSVEVLESFPYLGSLIHCTGDRALEIKRRVSIIRRLYDGSRLQHLALPHLCRYQIVPLTHAFCQSFCIVRRLGP